MRAAILLLQLFAGLGYAYRAYDVAHEINQTEVELRRMWEQMARLNKIQQNIMHKKGPNGRIPSFRVTSASESISWDQDIQTQPDKLPFLFEGDIILTESQMEEIIQNAEDQLWAVGDETVARKKRSMTSNLSLRWTFPIPYYVNTATGVSENAVLAGVNHWESQTCATFTRLPTPTYNGNFIEFFLGSGCYSYIGMVQTGKQQISIGYGCTALGTVTHEIGHALGFFHEQARYDRDNYVTIVTQNIQPNYLSQFSKQSKSSMEDYGVHYDYGSVMHYDQSSFTANNGQTISTKDPNYQMTIGQRMAPSFADVKKVNLAYCNASCTVQLDCQNGGYTDPKNCSQCRCPDGFGGVLCDRASNAVAACGTGDLTANNTMQTIQAQGTLNCPYVITAPPGKKVYFELGDFAFTYWIPCSVDFLEIKYNEDVVPAGARFCQNYPSNSLSEGNRLVVIYKGSTSSRFSLRFRQDPVDSTGSTVAPTTTSAAPTTASTTVKTTTAGTTQAPPTTTASTPAPTTTYPWWTTEAPTTTKFVISTFFPWSSSSTAATTTTTGLPPSRIQCSVWTACTARCGGCGTTSRRCGKDIETRYCNLQPCTNNYCCLPFFYVKQGLCIRPYSDEEVIQESISKRVVKG